MSGGILYSTVIQPRTNSQLIMRTWPRRLVFPTPEFPMITTLTVRMGNGSNEWLRCPRPENLPVCAAGRQSVLL
jgi:hypothetical protein